MKLLSQQVIDFPFDPFAASREIGATFMAENKARDIRQAIEELDQIVSFIGNDTSNWI